MYFYDVCRVFDSTSIPILYFTSSLDIPSVFTSAFDV